MGRFKIDREAGRILVWENGELLCSVPENDYSHIRPALEALGKSSHAIGAVVRLVNQKFPFKAPEPSPNTLNGHSLAYYIEYLTSRGYRVFMPEDISDDEIIKHLNSKGYVVQPPPFVDNRETNLPEDKGNYGGR
jgi:hypothetical protein